MKRPTREDRIEAALADIELAKASRSEGRPKTKSERQGVLGFQYEAEADGDEVTAWSGLPLIVEVMKQFGVERHAEALSLRERDAGFSAFELVTSFVLLMAAGGDCLDDIRMLREDRALCALLGHELPSADTLRRTLEAFHDKEAMVARPTEQGKAWIAPETARLKALGGMMAKLVEAVALNEPVPVTSATLDHDATVIEAHKKEALWHYKGGRGYQPSVVTWAETSLVLADEFRDGNVPAGMSNVPLIERAFAVLPASVTERFFRSDSACYEDQVLKWLSDPKQKVGFAISADMSRELRAACVATPSAAWSLFEQREDVTIEIAEVEFTPGTWSKNAWPLRYLGLRFRQVQNALFSDGSSERYFAVVTNREGDASAIVDWHRQKAGTIEQVHDIVKNELGGGVLPSGKFGANAAWFRLALYTHNVLVAMKRLVLPPELKLARPKRLRFRVFTLPAKVISHARQLFARVAARLLDALDALGVRRRTLALVPS